LEVSGAVP